MNEYCGDCKYWQNEEDRVLYRSEDKSECWVNPPNMVYYPSKDEFVPVYPRTSAYAVCSHFKEKRSYF